MRIVNVEVERTGSESTANLIRRFTKRVQSSGMLRRVRGERYRARAVSRYVRKKKALKKLARRSYYEEQLRLGKIQEKTPRG